MRSKFTMGFIGVLLMAIAILLLVFTTTARANPLFHKFSGVEKECQRHSISRVIEVREDEEVQIVPDIAGGEESYSFYGYTSSMYGEVVVVVIYKCKS
jgi:hypothetical protein